MLPRVHVLGTGGTISAKSGAPTQMTGYTASTIGIQELIEAVPEITEFATITGEQVTNVLSSSLTFGIWLKLANRVNEVLRSEDVTGVVITHGTNTLEETAYFLNLVVKSEKPVILTGAMRPATAISAEGPINLLNAVRLAASPVSRGQGVLVCLNDKINAARDVTKTNTMAVETFQAPELGYLGYIQEGKPYIFRRSTRRHTIESEFDIQGIDMLPRVDIVYGYAGDDAVLLEAAIRAGARGIVVAAPGHGMPSDILKAGLIEASKQGVVVVKASRSGNGLVTPVLDDQRHYFVASGSLNPQKARILLALALKKTNDPVEIQRMFDVY